MRNQAEQMIETYRKTAAWSSDSQVVLQCVLAIWTDSFPISRIVALPQPLTGVGISLEAAKHQLSLMKRVKLLATRTISGVTHYELAFA
jgi:hypothetical protein